MRMHNLLQAYLSLFVGAHDHEPNPKSRTRYHACIGHLGNLGQKGACYHIVLDKNVQL